MLVGHCCITLSPDGTKRPNLKFASASVAHVSKLSARERRAYIERCVEQNLNALQATIRHLMVGHAHDRMFRITSGLLPLYTHEVAKPIYLDPGFHRQLRRRLEVIGESARGAGAHTGVRLSFHPGQYCVLNSAEERIRRASIEEFEHHVRIAHYMGFSGCNARRWATRRNGQQQLDNFAINVHGGAWHGNQDDSIESWRWSWRRMSRAAKRLITLENDEFGWGAEDILELCKWLRVRMVPDVHHHWVRTGEWLDPDSDFVKQMYLTWPLGHPKMHVSLPQIEYFTQSDKLTDEAPFNPRVYPHMRYRLPARPEGVSLTKLRSHSNYIYHPGMIHYLNGWVDKGWDIQVESKAKNLASEAVSASLAHLRGKQVYFDRNRGRWLVSPHDNPFFPKRLRNDEAPALTAQQITGTHRP